MIKNLILYFNFLLIFSMLFIVIIEFKSNLSYLLICSDYKKSIEIEDIRKIPIIFIGGSPRSGTTLMRSILDTHPDIICGPESIIVPDILNFHENLFKSGRKIDFLIEAGISPYLIDQAVSLFIYHILEKRNIDKTGRACLKDPIILEYMNILIRIFPNAKFIHMYRDGRNEAYSHMIRRKERNHNLTTYLKYLDIWNVYNKKVDKMCKKEYCIQVKYENLVEKPELEIRKVIGFLNESWTNELLRHEKHVGKNVILSKYEWSSDQVKKPINKEALKPIWIDKYPNLNISLFSKYEMLKKFAYI